MKRGVIAILLLSAIFLAGCNLFAGNNANPGKGVGIRFSPVTPSGQISEGIPFNVEVILINNGLSSADGELCISDTFSSLFGGIEAARDCQSFALAGLEEADEVSLGRDDKRTFPQGAGAYIYSGIEGKNFETYIEAEAVYDYRTLINPQICVANNERDCGGLTRSYSGASLGQDAARAPVTITRIDQRMTPTFSSTGVSLDILVENNGGGEVVTGLGFNSDDRNRASFEERVNFNINAIGSGVQFNCKPSGNGVILLDKKRKMISCSAEIPVEGGRTDIPLEIELLYTYSVSLKTGVFKIVDTD